MNRKEKQEARADRYRELARKAEQQSNDAYNRSHRLVDHIPMGQPILVGHHSERAHRNLLDKSWNAMGKSVELSKKADYYQGKAEAAENNTSIYMEDDDAVERLQEKVEELEKQQEVMKSANKIIRNKKTADIVKVDQLKELGISESTALLLIKNGGFASYRLTNNGACIRNTKKQLERAERLKGMEEKEYSINDVRVVENPQENRLQLFFSGKPSDDVRQQLKRNGFRWAPSNGCWQSYYNRWQIDRAKELLNNL